jgi:Putative Flp pilus-assembly TadE/G-like
MTRMPVCLAALISRFREDNRGSIAVIFAVAIVPILLGVGAAIDFSRANSFRNTMQAALDTALLGGAKDGGASWAQIASNIFSSNAQNGYSNTISSSFSQPSSTIYTGTASGSVPTTFLGIFHVSTIPVSVKATAVASGPDNSCILTLDHGQPTSHTSLLLNGAPVVNLSGCSIRSNTAMDCNGHDGNNTAAIAGGTAAACSHPYSNQAIVPDVYAPLAANIATQCGSSRPGVTWSAGTLPGGSGVIKVTSGIYTEYHICGDLTLSGSGDLTQSNPTSDTVIAVENGSINVASGANISSARTALVLTGSNAYASQINFPTGNGQSATLSLSAPSDPSGAWQGVALYEDPKLTYKVDNKWGPGATLNVDGLAYLGNSNVTTDGNTGSNNSQCSKFVFNSFTTNGSVDLQLQQQTNACAAIGLKQWNGVVVHLTQ